jgi:hypothetical protein
LENYLKNLEKIEENDLIDIKDIIIMIEEYKNSKIKFEGIVKYILQNGIREIKEIDKSDIKIL